MKTYFGGIVVQPSTKAQIQIGETIAVILVFVMLMIFGIYWMATATTASNTQQLSIQDRTDLLETAKLVMNLPELHCSIASVVDTACIDKYRLEAVKNLAVAGGDVQELYQDRFIGADRGSYSLYITALTPGTAREYEVFDYTVGSENASSQTVAIPVLVYDPITKMKQFGMAELTHEVLR
jgi:hypothetical protein